MARNRKGNYYPPAVARADASVASAARTTTGTSTAYNVEETRSLEATLTVTAAAGTSPTLDVALETTVDGTNWYQVAAFSQKTGSSTDARVFGPLGRKARWKWTIGGSGSPSFTFKVDAKARN